MAHRELSCSDFKNSGVHLEYCPNRDSDAFISLPFKYIKKKRLEFRVFGHEPSILRGPARNLSLLQTPTFWNCLASLCIGRRNLCLVTSLLKEDKVRTTVSHDLQMQTTVVATTQKNTQLIYSASM